MPRPGALSNSNVPSPDPVRDPRPERALTILAHRQRTVADVDEPQRPVAILDDGARDSGGNAAEGNEPLGLHVANPARRRHPHPPLTEGRVRGKCLNRPRVNARDARDGNTGRPRRSAGAGRRRPETSGVRRRVRTVPGRRGRGRRRRPGSIRVEAQRIELRRQLVVEHQRRERRAARAVAAERPRVRRVSAEFHSA